MPYNFQTNPASYNIEEYVRFVDKVRYLFLNKDQGIKRTVMMTIFQVQ